MDKITLGEFLSASGISSLDNSSDALNSNGRSLRENGVVLQVTIDYRNADSVFFGTRCVTEVMINI